MLNQEIAETQRFVRTDAYQMSVGEIVSMYATNEIVIDPEFQRLFRWSVGQKSKLIESLLLGIPVPSIFVFEREDGKWELVDGLQRLSTILEFMGELRSPDGGVLPPSALVATKYLPSLSNSVWELSAQVEGVIEDDQAPLEKSHQLAIRRARLGVEILKRPSDNQTKFDLFQRLNAGGTQANAQELRNCIVLMVNPPFFRQVKAVAESGSFLDLIGATQDQMERQRHMEWAVRFLVHTNVPYDGKLDVEEYIDEGIVQIAASEAGPEQVQAMSATIELLTNAGGSDLLRRLEGGQRTGKIGFVGFEVIAVGVAKNLPAIMALEDPAGFVRSRSDDFWALAEYGRFTSPGLRGTTRIQRTVPFGQAHFAP